MTMNVMEIMKNNNAYKTIKLRDLLKVDNSVLDILQMKTPEQTQKLQRMFKALFNDYEIGGETPTQFNEFVEDVHSEYIDYYQEVIDTYEEKINYLDGYKSITNIEDNVNRNEVYSKSKNGSYNTSNNFTNSETTSGSLSSEIKNKDFSLPHKQVDSVTGYLTAQKDNDENKTVSNVGSNTGSNTINHTDGEEENRDNTITANNTQVITKTGGANVVDQKFNYINKLRNVYKEFAEKFSVCFLQVY